ncbi:hypothetical protein V8C35DRAFT_287408 [Trichoderma chlorosporum]
MPVKLPPHFNFFPFPSRALCTAVLSPLLAVPPSTVFFVFFRPSCHLPFFSSWRPCCIPVRARQETRPSPIVWPFLFLILHRPLCRLQSPYRHASTRPAVRRVKCQQISSRRAAQTCPEPVSAPILCNRSPSASTVAEGRREPAL